MYILIKSSILLKSCSIKHSVLLHFICYTTVFQWFFILLLIHDILDFFLLPFEIFDFFFAPFWVRNAIIMLFRVQFGRLQSSVSHHNSWLHVMVWHCDGHIGIFFIFYIHLLGQIFFKYDCATWWRAFIIMKKETFITQSMTYFRIFLLGLTITRIIKNKVDHYT